MTKPTKKTKTDPKNLKGKQALLDKFDEMIDEVVEEKTTIVLYNDGGEPVAAIVPYEAVEMLEEIAEQHEEHRLAAPQRYDDDEIVGKLPLHIIQQLMNGKKN